MPKPNINKARKDKFFLSCLLSDLLSFDFKTEKFTELKNDREI